jgi:hypothetical protein
MQVPTHEHSTHANAQKESVHETVKTGQKYHAHN